MQLDMHYYATYAMARAVGIEPDDARIIATSAQFVDDNIARSHVNFRDGSRIDQEATAHHPINLSNPGRPRPAQGLGTFPLHSGQ